MDAKERKETEKRVRANFHWYLDHQEELVKEYNGQHLVIVDKKNSW